MDLWLKVLDEGNENRKAMVDQVIGTALPESRNPDQVGDVAPLVHLVLGFCRVQGIITKGRLNPEKAQLQLVLGSSGVGCRGVKPKKLNSKP